MIVHIRCVTAAPDATNQSEWLKVIWETNTIRPGTFGLPTIGKWWAGGTVEEYPDARVIHRTDGSTSITALTPEGGAALREAATRLGIYLPPCEHQVRNDTGRCVFCNVQWWPPQENQAS